MVGIVSVAQQSGGGEFLTRIFNDTDTSESNDTAEECGVLLTMHLVLVDDAKRSLVVLADGISLMSLYGTVEVKATLMIDETDGDGVWIVVVSQQGEGARSGMLKNGDALLPGELLPVSAHGSEIAHNDIDCIPVLRRRKIA